MKKAFTLIELLVVIAIIAILAAILFPVFAQAKLAAKKTVALSNSKEISLGLVMYSTDSDDMIFPSATAEYTINRTPQAYVWKPVACLMQPYTKNYDIWTAPADPHTPTTNDNDLWDGSLGGRNGKRQSFGYVSKVNTKLGGSNDLNTGIGPWISDLPPNAATAGPVRSMTAFDEPSNTISFVEIWDDGKVGQLGGSVIVGCDLKKLAGRKQGVDEVAPGCNVNDSVATKGYANGTANYSMTDGSAKSYSWSQVRANDFYRFKVSKPTTAAVTP